MSIGSLATHQRIDLAHSPTPFEELSNLSSALDGARLFVKRDDCTGLAFGGNKVRQLEFYFGKALEEGADTVLITGAVQSNFVRLAAAGARKLGLECHIQLEERVQHADPVYHRSGNVLLDRMLGAILYSYPQGEDEVGADRQLSEIAARLRSNGRKTYIIPLSPGHPPLGALGYVRAAEELLGQAAGSGIKIDEVVVPSGSGHTHAGLLFGLRAYGSHARVTGVCVRRNAQLQRTRILDRCCEIAKLLNMEPPVDASDVHLVDDFLAPGYGQLNEATLNAMRIAARHEALMLDPVYTGKSMAGFIQRAKQARPGDTLVFVHTGGMPALFAYEPMLSAAL